MSTESTPDRAERRRDARAARKPAVVGLAPTPNRARRRADGQRNRPMVVAVVSKPGRMTAAQRRTRNLRRLNARVNYGRCQDCRTRVFYTLNSLGLCDSCTTDVVEVSA